MTRPTDPLFDQRIADWLEDDPLQAPGQVLEIVLAALPSIPRRHASHLPWRFIAMPVSSRWSVAAAVVVGVLVVGGALYMNRPSQPAVGGPSSTPTVSTSPSQPATPTGSPSSSVVAARAPSWTATGSMVQPFADGTATLLLGGKVLVAGGYSSLAPPNGFARLSTLAQLYDPATGTWTATGTMVTSRVGGTATLLPDGKVLVAGGRAGALALASAELYDPGSGSWTATGSMTTPRESHTATLLPDGEVLVAGGNNAAGNGSLASAELYDPSSGSWTATGSMVAARGLHTATLLRDGKVLVAGGQCCGDGTVLLASAELYDPASGTWIATGSMVNPRAGHTATLLPDGTLLVAGGRGVSSAELYDPGTGSWIPTGKMVAGRVSQTATLLANGKVLVAGGGAGGSGPVPAELYDPASGSWTATGAMVTSRGYQAATLLPDGRVLMAGGSDNSGFAFSPLASAELYDPGSGQ